MVLGYNAERRTSSIGGRQAKADLVGLPRRWDERVFAPEEGRLAAPGARDVAVKRRIRAEQGQDSPPRAPGRTMQFFFGPGIRRIVLAASVYNRPACTTLQHDAAGLHVILFPVADDSLEPGAAPAPPRSLPRLYKALGDATRLKIPRLVSQEELHAIESVEGEGKRALSPANSSRPIATHLAAAPAEPPVAPTIVTDR